jgi:hypothetical protein
MIFQRVAKSSPEQVFMVVKNVSGSTMTAGYHCAWDVSATADGVNVSQIGSACLQAYAGVANAAIANGAYGLIQVYGYRSSAYIYSSTGSSAAGDNLSVVASEWGVTPATTGGAAKTFGFLCEAITGSTSSQYHTTAKIFIRAL